jgi:hypothetical protein
VETEEQAEAVERFARRFRQQQAGPPDPASGGGSPSGKEGEEAE